MSQGVLRSECLYNGEIIGIESIYTVVNGKQINIPERLESLREKGKNRLLFCPCGCGANLTVVAGDRALRNQHFRILPGANKNTCSYIDEGQNSIDSKIVIKCWLTDKLHQDVQTRVPISTIADTDRKYEVSHYVPSIRFAVNYSNLRNNLEDEKLGLLTFVFGNSILFIVDIDNLDTFGQYPEYMNKIQSRQGYCLFLQINGREYDKAQLYVAFYAKNADGLYKRVGIESGALKDFSFAKDNKLLYKGESVEQHYLQKKIQFDEEIEKEEKEREERQKKRAEQLEKEKKEQEQRAVERHKKLEKWIWQQQVDAQQEKESEAKQPYEEKKRLDLRIIQDSIRAKFGSEIDAYIDKPYIDPSGRRLFKCEICGKVGGTEDFSEFGGEHKAAKGICRECARAGKNMPSIEEGEVCSVCGSKLVVREGTFGPSIRCSTYPKCKYIKK